MDVLNDETFMYGILLPVVVFFGYLGNILTAIVLWKKEMASTNNILLRALVLSDIVMITTIFIVLSLPFLLTKLIDNEEATAAIFIHGHSTLNYLVMTSQQCNEYILVFLSAERYFAVCHPLKYVNFTSKGKTIALLCGVICCSIAYNIPRILAFTVHKASCVNENSSFTCYTLLYTDFGSGYFYQEVYSIWLYSAIYFVIPLAILLILNILIIKELAKMWNIRKRLGVVNSPNAKKDSITLSLVLIMVVFGVVQTLGFFNQFPNILDDGIDQDMFIKCVNVLYVINSSINFLIYVVVGKKFRKNVSDLFKTWFHCSPCTKPSTEYRLSELSSFRN
ncbi:G-protein coupled receptor daf-37-like [Mizuhopecten yessoensis]|uniref:G-protein coupled receptor daf-37-like n=1 Tax=Mizuhopecten yessoensis TaxID=6573 RepID=UPI000B45BB43|nr:G-protein coupled receptor daf-37-like [Mizuhopecten yessoensis]